MSKLEIIESEKNYTATVVKLPHKQPVPWLDNLVKVTVFWNDCLVSKDADENELHIFFLCESILSKDFLRFNNLYRDSTKNIDPDKKWFFEDHGRVKAIKFKWITSTGFLIPASSINNIGGDVKLKEHDEFHIIDGVEICRKYIRPVNTPKTRNDKRNDVLKRFDILIPWQFKFHDDTLHFLKYIDTFQPEDYISITEKYHGTSAVFSNVLVSKKLWFLDRILKKLGITIQETEYHTLYASRTVVKNRYINETQTDWFYWEDIWEDVAKELDGKIEKGITLYGEIVWYTNGGAQIQKWYHYGCQQWEHKLIVYRITSTNHDWFHTEFTDSQIREYCERYWLEVANKLWYGKVSEIGQNTEEIGKNIEQMFPIEKMCPMNNNEVPYEGIVIRRDWKSKFDAYKIKSRMFLWYETKLLDEWVEIIS